MHKKGWKGGFYLPQPQSFYMSFFVNSLKWRPAFWKVCWVQKENPTSFFLLLSYDSFKSWLQFKVVNFNWVDFASATNGTNPSRLFAVKGKISPSPGSPYSYECQNIWSLSGRGWAVPGCDPTGSSVLHLYSYSVITASLLLSVIAWLRALLLSFKKIIVSGLILLPS